MTRQELEAALTTWQDHMRDCEAQMDALERLVGATPEAPLQHAIYTIMGAYTRELAARIQWDADTLVDWWLTHNFGERPMKIGHAGKPLETVATVEDLALFIADDLEGV